MDADLQALYDSADATTALRVQLLGVQAQRDWLVYSRARDAEASVRRDAEAALYAQHRAEDVARAERNAATWERQAANGDALLGLQTKLESGLLNPVQERFMSLIPAMLKTRLGPAIITSATSQEVIQDIVRDAVVGMAAFASPLVEAELDKLK